MTGEAAEWLALHRAHEGAVAKLNGSYFNHGRPVTTALAATFEDLITSGLLALGRPDLRGRQQVCVTHTGQTKYGALRNGQGHHQQGKAGR